ncbi:MAG TPA: thiamine phosphate synthase [Blastocatellia bacterium]|nr:thiamine phosphate synthase [Blastocatellia bacterium]
MLSGPIIYPITEGLAEASNFGEQLARIRANAVAAAESGVGLFQIREKRLSARSLFELTSSVVSATTGSGLGVIVNGRPDVAAAAGAAGVHLPANGLPADAVRRSFGPEFLIGVSCHDDDELLAAQRGGADFATFSPVFASPGKGEPTGIEKLRAAVEKFDGFPVIALGGISLDNIAAVLATKAAGVAAIRALSTPERIREFAARAN